MSTSPTATSKLVTLHRVDRDRPGVQPSFTLRRRAVDLPGRVADWHMPRVASVARGSSGCHEGGEMAVLRTPDDLFQGLQDYDFEPHYVTIVDERLGPLRMHYLDEGDPAAPVVLLLRREPTWSYLFRHCVAPLVAAGCHAVAPDLVGFGRSDKPDSPGDFTYEAHVRWLSSFVVAVGLKDAVVVGHHRAGCLACGWSPGSKPWRWLNVWRQTMVIRPETCRPTTRYGEWQRFAAAAPVFDVSAIVARACVTELDQAVRSAYDAPATLARSTRPARGCSRRLSLSRRIICQPRRFVTRGRPRHARPCHSGRSTASRTRSPAWRTACSELVPGASGPARPVRTGHNMPEDAGAAFRQIVARFAQSLHRGT